MFLSDNKKKERERERNYFYFSRSYFFEKASRCMMRYFIYVIIILYGKVSFETILFTVRYEREVIFISSFFFLKNAIEKKII